MRSLIGLLLLSLAGLPLLPAAEVKFVRVWPAWRDAASFERIAEYFTGQENTGNETILRTDPERRAGFYYLVRVANSGSSLPGATFVLQVISPSRREAQTTTFRTDIPARSQVFQLGLTSADWSGPEIHPVAWKLELRSADDQVLASAHSFLWEKPPQK